MLAAPRAVVAPSRVSRALRGKTAARPVRRALYVSAVTEVRLPHPESLGDPRPPLVLARSRSSCRRNIMICR